MIASLGFVSLATALHGVAAHDGVGITERLGQTFRRGRIGIADIPQLEHRLAPHLRLGIVQVGNPRFHLAAAGENGPALLSVAP